MKFLLTGDFHLRTVSPENRVDNFFETQKNKIEKILQIAIKEKCRHILQPGDFTDTPRPSFGLIEEYVSLFKKYGVSSGLEINHVYGQHDMYCRTQAHTATKLFNFLGYLREVDGLYKLSDNIHLYGVSWGDGIPEIEDKDCFNILLIHKTIIEKSLWPGQDDYLQSDKLYKYGYDVILCGDNHHPVFYQHKEQAIVGCGCLVRKTIAEADLIPHIYILDVDEDTFKYTLEKIEIQHEPADKVFKPEALAREIKKENEKLQEFINNIKNNSMNKNLDFKKNLENLMQPIEQPIKDIILKELELIHE